MYTKSDDLLYIEKCLSAIKANIDIDENIKKVETTLNRVFEINTHITIINNIGNFFGINVYPSKELMDDVVKLVVMTDKCKTETVITKWYESNDWYIEIDNLLLSEFALNASPAEIIAIMLHEISNVMYFDRIPTIFTNMTRNHIVGLNYTLKCLVRDEKIRNLFKFALIEACISKNFRYESVSYSKITNKLISSYGYWNDFESVINKVIKVFGNTLVNREDVEIHKDIRSIINWIVTNIHQLELRKQTLKLALKTEMLKTSSYYIKSMTQEIYRDFFGSAIDQYRVLLSEQYMDVGRDVYSELQGEQNLNNYVRKIITESSGANLWDKKGKIKKISQSDIDVLMVESEKIESVDDKIYLLDKLYAQYEIVTTALDYMSSNDWHLTEKVQQSKPTLESFKKQLEMIRSKILNTKIIEKEYGVFIKYPKGYQG